MPYGIDPFETKDVKINGVTFTIGHIFSRKMLELRAQLASLRSNIEEASTTDEIIGMGSFNYNLVRYSVRGHKDFIIKDKAVEFKTDTVNEFGKNRNVVSEDVMEYYAANMLLPKLVNEILQFTNLTEQEQKN